MRAGLGLALLLLLPLAGRAEADPWAPLDALERRGAPRPFPREGAALWWEPRARDPRLLLSELAALRLAAAEAELELVAALPAGALWPSAELPCPAILARAPGPDWAPSLGLSEEPGLLLIEDGAVTRFNAAAALPGLRARARAGAPRRGRSIGQVLADAQNKAERAVAAEDGLEAAAAEAVGIGEQGLAALWGYIKEHLTELALLGVAAMRLMGATVKSGWRGVLFRFGRACEVREPGFHPLLPWLWKIRAVRVRSVTLDLARQRVTSADGLVFEVDANIVYRVEDPLRALVEVASIRDGVALALALSVQELTATREMGRGAELEAGEEDEELAARVQGRIARWGLVVERAGLASRSPDRASNRVLQLRARVAERRQEWRRLRAGGVGRAAELLGLERGRRPRRRRPRGAARAKGLVSGWGGGYTDGDLRSPPPDRPERAA